jgi:hypothetical protein
MERYKLIHVLLSEEDVRVLMESLWHACQRGDIPDEDRERAPSFADSRRLRSASSTYD